MATERFQTLLLSSFGAAALLLALLGVYGVLTYRCRCGSRSLGFGLRWGRIARRLTLLVLRQAAYPVVSGIVVGLGGAFVVTRWVRSLLYETQPADPVAIGTASAAVGRGLRSGCDSGATGGGSRPDAGFEDGVERNCPDDFALNEGEAVRWAGTPVGYAQCRMRTAWRFLSRRMFTVLGCVLACVFLAKGSCAQPGSVTLTPEVVEAGSPVLIHVDAGSDASLEGDWLGRKLEFFPASGGRGWYALAGVDVEAPVGPSTLRISLRLRDGSTRDLNRAVEIHAAHYRTGSLTVAPKFVEPAPDDLSKN